LTERAPEHAPKVAALRAEAAGLLSGVGRARLLRHVESCEVCAEHLRGARRFHALVSRATGVPSFDSEKSVRSAVMRNRLAQRRTRIQWGGVVVAAGVLIAVMLATRHNEAMHARDKPAVAPKAPSAAPAVESKLLAITVTALRGAVQLIEPTRRERPLAIEDSVGEHSALHTGAGASVDLALADEASVHLAADSEVALDATRSDRVALRLIRGELSNAVAKRSAEQSYEVIAAGHRVTVRGTLFAVRASAEHGVSVQCDEGSVEVMAPDGKSALLTAPASWSERVAGTAGTTAPPPKLQATKPYAAKGSAVLTLPSLPGIAGWEIAGQAQPASDLLKMRVPPGALELVALLGDGRREMARIQVDGVGAQIAPADLPFLKAPEAPITTPTPGAETDIDASSVILAGRPALQRCYERSLKNESSGSHALRLSISIDPRGRVRKVEPASQKPGETLPLELAQCIRTAVLAWHFPAPGGDGLVLEAPLRFQLRR
jgi:ferric-dicitrate binding protein FerR (iron transport regulator)